MENALNPSILPNPDTYLNYLSPTDAKVFEICRNITLVVFGATIWDILIYIPDDIRIIRRSSFCLVIFCFIFSRLFAAGYVFLGVMERTVPNNNPRTPAVVAGCLNALSMSCTSYLFLRRLHAVYADKQWVRWTFSGFWLIHIVSELAVPLGVKPTHIPGTHYSQDTYIQPYVAVIGFIVFLFDTSIFLAISYKIATSHSGLDNRIGWDTLISGKALPRLSRAILRGGQQYYLMTIGLTTFVGVTVYIPSVHPSIKVTLSIPFVPFVASMACRVFRNTKLYDFNPTSTQAISDIHFVSDIVPAN